MKKLGPRFLVYNRAVLATVFSIYNLKFFENIKNSGVAVQVKFWDGENWCAGFMVDRRLVCGSCGGIFDVDEVLRDGREEGIENPISVLDTWVDVSDEIWGVDEEEV